MPARIRKKASRAGLFFVAFWSVVAFSTDASAVQVFFADVHASAQGCPTGSTCPPDPVVSDTQTVTQGPTSSAIAINTSASAPGALSSSSANVDSGGIIANGTASTSNSGNVVGSPGVQASSFVEGEMSKFYILSSSSLPTGTLVQLSAQFGFSGTLQAQSMSGSGSVVQASLGPLIAYGSGPDSVFDIFMFAIRGVFT